MKKSTQLFIILPLLLRLVGEIMVHLNYDYGSEVRISSYFALLILAVYLIFTTKKPYYPYSIVLALALFNVVGSAFKIMHWPNASTMLLLGMAGAIGAGLLLILSSVKNKSVLHALYHPVLGLILILQVLTPIVLPSLSTVYLQLMNYPIAALSGTIILNKSETNQGERNMLIFIFVQAMLFVISHVFKLL